jgi:hypothetical protein
VNYPWYGIVPIPHPSVNRIVDIARLERTVEEDSISALPPERGQFPTYLNSTRSDACPDRLTVRRIALMGDSNVGSGSVASSSLKLLHAPPTN